MVCALAAPAAPRTKTAVRPSRRSRFGSLIAAREKWNLGVPCNLIEASPGGGRRRQRTDKAAMARKYSKGASKDVERAMRKRKRGTLRSGKGGRGGKVKSRKQAIAIGLSEARKKGKKVPRRKASR